MLSKRKKIIILVSMFVLLLVTGYLNIMLNNKTVETTNSDTYTTATFFSSYRTDRTSTRNEAIEYYQDIIKNESASQEAKESAEIGINKIVEAMSLELSMEGLIKAKGFNEALVSYSDTYIDVIVQSAELNENEVAQIVECIQGKVDRDIDYIKIIPVEWLILSNYYAIISWKFLGVFYG